MSDYKLHYFNIRARGEYIRLLLVHAGQEFEDIRYNSADWLEKKKDTPRGQLPFLEVPSGRRYSESSAIIRMLGRKFALYGEDVEEQYQIDRALGEMEDVMKEVFKLWYHTPSDTKAREIQSFIDGKGEKLFRIIIASYKESGGQFLASKNISIADMVYITIWDYLNDGFKQLLEKLPELTELREKIVKASPKVADWIAKRPVTN